MKVVLQLYNTQLFRNMFNILTVLPKSLSDTLFNCLMVKQMSAKKIVAVKIDSNDLDEIDKIVRARTVENNGEVVTRSNLVREWIYSGFKRELKKIPMSEASV
jgi:hypothetical protein